jgi:hypothetical protein
MTNPLLIEFSFSNCYLDCMDATKPNNSGLKKLRLGKQRLS